MWLFLFLCWKGGVVGCRQEQSSEDGDDIFVHHTAIESDGFRTLEEGDKVEFEIVKGDKGNKAEKVKKI